MKKIINVVLIVIVSLIIFLLAFNYKVVANPNVFYQVYLDGKTIGVIRSKEELNNYIDKKNKNKSVQAL